MVDSSKELTTTDTTDTTESSVEQSTEIPKKSLVGRIKQWRSGWGERWSKLHANQVIYVIALVLYFVVDGDIEEPNTALWLIGLLAFFGMARELWAIFTKIWESTFGRLVLLVMYAAIANFTLALASQKINMVIGADPSYLYHTQGIATLLMLPLWIMIVSIVAVVFMFGLLQVLKLVTGLFILLRIIGKNTKPKEAFPKTFVVIRLILLFPVIMTMTSAVLWYGERLNLDMSGSFKIGNAAENMAGKQIAQIGIVGIEESLQNEDLTDEERAELLKLRDNLINELAGNNTNESVQVSEDQVEPTLPEIEQEPTETVEANTNEEETTSEEPYYFLDDLIASFVYNYEAFKFSHCNKTEQERVVYITESEILAVVKDETAPNGYRFSTRTCVVNNPVANDVSDTPKTPENSE